jgi:hypothetical protein
MRPNPLDPLNSNVYKSVVSGVSGNPVPEFSSLGLKRISYVPVEAPGKAAIAFNNREIERSMEELGQLQQSLNKTLFNEAIIKATESTARASEQWIQSNPTGEGYSGFVVGFWNKQIKDLAKSSPNREVSELVKLHGESAMPDMMLSSLHQEKQLRTKYLSSSIEQNKQAILSQLISNTDLVSPLRLQYEQQLEAIRGVLSAGEYEHYRSEGMDEFGKTYGVALIQRDPRGALAQLERSSIDGIHADTRLALMEHAKHAVHAEEVRRRQSAELESNLQLANGSLKTAMLLAQAATGRGTQASTDSTEISSSNQQMIRRLMDHMDIHRTSQLKGLHDVLDTMSQNRPLYGYSHSAVNRAYDFMISSNPEFTLVEKAQIAVSMQANTRIDNLTSDISNALQFSNDPQKVVNGCQAFRLLQDSNPKLIGGNGIDKRLEYFSTAVLNQTLNEGENSTNLKESIYRNRRIFFEPLTKEVEGVRRKEFNDFAKEGVNSIVANVLDYEWEHLFSEEYSSNQEKTLDKATLGTLTTDAYRISRAAMMSGTDRQTAKATAINWLKRNYGRTVLNGKHPMQVMKYPPELIYPEHNKNIFVNEMAEEAQRLVLANMEEFGDDSEVKLDGNIYETTSSKKYLPDIDYSRNGMKILVRIGSEYQKVRVKIESDPLEKGLYYLYYEFEVDGLKGRRYLRHPRDILRTPFRFKFPEVST